jgi:N utilization substance protein A
MNSMSNDPTNIVHELFAREVPEIMDGDVRIKAISREIGYRSKVAVQKN